VKRFPKWIFIWVIAVPLCLVFVYTLSTSLLLHRAPVEAAPPAPSPSGTVYVPSKVSITLENDTGNTITGFYISPHGLNDWTLNFLHTPLKRGSKTVIQLTLNAESPKWDLRLDFNDHTRADFLEGYDLANLTLVGFNSWGGKGTTSIFYTHR